MSAAARILDANANRAREALRVMEDAARFALDDAKLCGRLKSVRHDLREALSDFEPGWLEVNRDTPGDVGTSIAQAHETSRAGLVDVVTAAGKRLTEALRVIEETSKTLKPQVARRIEAIRYRAYEAETALHFRMASGRARQWRVCVLLTESRCARPWPEVLKAAIGGGADCIQVREPECTDLKLCRRVEGVLAEAQQAGVSVIVNDRVDVALAVGADGAHLGREDLGVRHARRLAGRGLIVGASTRGPDEARAAIEAGADYCGVGAIFETSTKEVPPLVGPAAVAAFVERFPLTPHLAIGGITPDNIGRLIDAGAKGVAVCSAVCGAQRPGEVVGLLREAMDRSNEPTK